MKNAPLFVNKVKGALHSVKLGVDIMLKTNPQGEINQVVDILDLIHQEVSSHTAGVDGPTIDIEWLRENVTGNDLSAMLVTDVEGPNGEWLGSEDAACTIRGPIETTVRLNNTTIRVSGISEEKTLDMTTKVRITSEGAPLFENMDYLLMAEVGISLN